MCSSAQSWYSCALWCWSQPPTNVLLTYLCLRLYLPLELKPCLWSCVQKLMHFLFPSYISMGLTQWEHYLVFKVNYYTQLYNLKTSLKTLDFWLAFWKLHCWPHQAHMLLQSSLLPPEESFLCRSPCSTQPHTGLNINKSVI